MAEDEIIKKHTQAVYSVLKNPEKKWVHKLKDILQEILIIVFAVSVSIWFHGWAEDRKDKKEEAEFYKGLKEDLEADVKEMQNDRSIITMVVNETRYFEKVGAGAVLSKDSLAKYYWVFFSAAQINPRISRFEALKGSGKLDIIEDKKKLYNIIDLYQKIFPNIFRVNQTMNDLNANKIAPYIGDVLQLDPAGNYLNAEALLHSSKMRLLMMQLEGAAQNSYNAYSNGIAKATEILKQLEQE